MSDGGWYRKYCSSHRIESHRYRRSQSMEPPATTPRESGSFEAFKEIAARSLGLVEQDEFELLPITTVLARIEALYSQEVTRFDAAAARLKLYETHFLEMASSIEVLRNCIVSMGVPLPKARTCETAAIEETVFSDQVQSDAHIRFREQFKPQLALNYLRGNYLYDFMIAHFMQLTPQFERLNRSMRAPLVSHAMGLASVYSIWENNKFGRVWSLAGADLPRSAFAKATYRLVDGLFQAVGFDFAYEIFKRYLNPLGQFPLQFLYDVIISDPKTLLQEYTQSNRGATPRYNVGRAGGADHAPEFCCTLTFAKHTYEGRGDSKSRAEVAAARKAVEFLLETDRRNMPLLIAEKISMGTKREDVGYPSARISYDKLLNFRRTIGATCSDETLRRCLTLRADIHAYGLSASATNELLAFCGSWLAQAINAEASQGDRSFALRPSAREEVCKMRSYVFQKTKDALSDSHYMDVIQSVMYVEFLLKGYDAAMSIFDRCIIRSRTTDHDVAVIELFELDVQYATILQEFTQKNGGTPEYHYVLTTPPNKAHAPIFRCRGAYDGTVAEASGSSKKIARQKAAFLLLQKLMEGADDAGTPQG